MREDAYLRERGRGEKGGNELKREGRGGGREGGRREGRVKKGVEEGGKEERGRGE